MNTFITENADKGRKRKTKKLHYTQEIRTRYNTYNELTILSFISCPDSIKVIVNSTM